MRAREREREDESKVCLLNWMFDDEDDWSRRLDRCFESTGCSTTTTTKVRLIHRVNWMFDDDDDWSRRLEAEPMHHRLASSEDPGLSVEVMGLSRWLVGATLLHGPKAKSLRISLFKGRAQNDESGSRVSGWKSAKNSVKLSYVQGSEETFTESQELQDAPLSYASEADETIEGSVAIQKLFKNWLTLLCTQPSNQVVDETLDGPDSGKISVMRNGVQKKERVNVAYGAEVSKELTPLWVCGPLVVALYIKILHGLCALYVFSFKQTVKLVNNLPTYYAVAYNYIGHGIYNHLWKHVVVIKNLDYKKLSKTKREDLELWAAEKYLDFVESIWPYYCRTIRLGKCRVDYLWELDLKVGTSCFGFLSITEQSDDSSVTQDAPFEASFAERMYKSSFQPLLRK
ncbi:hypothetical protein TEA_004255 [Camellia sinensis var. sinensis]|uniref:Uncharacterized protein n=1 Tax=Camellia sinensis var. sinensis TaxID=542762 RepID=A0A4S4E6H1_CAMSN|nr:hypothetical protein TEA_004255 [Camellia sinensis var. sinensis]